jgi:putative hydrolase of the HAD superfamily
VKTSAPPQDKFLIWDFDGTLAYRDGRSWSHTLAEVAREHADLPDVTADTLRPYVLSGFPWHTPERQHGPWTSADAWWDALFPVFENAFRSACGFSASDAQRLAERMRPAYLDLKRWSVFDDTREGLDALTERGWQHILLSNHVPELPQLVEALGLTKHISRLFNSAQTGFEKPHSQAFLNVLQSMPRNAAVWMIGDSIEADIKGAEAVGVRAILLRSQSPHVPLCCGNIERVVATLRNAGF